MTNILKKTLIIALALDIVGFLMWGFSGQFPQDSFYLGAITRNILITLL